MPPTPFAPSGGNLQCLDADDMDTSSDTADSDRFDRDTEEENEAGGCNIWFFARKRPIGRCR